MARTSGFIMTRRIRNFLRVLGVTDETFTNLGITEAQAIHEVRAMCNKYQELVNIQSDLNEMAAMEHGEAQAEGPVEGE